MSARSEREAGALVGPRVELCEPIAADENEFVALRRASREFLAPWEVSLEGDDPFGPERFRRFLKRGPTRRRFLVRSRGSGELVGALAFSEIDREARSASVGYWIGAQHARQGLMGEALDLALAWARATYRLKRVDAFVLPENAASIALLRRRGFARVALVERFRNVAGEVRDHERWSLAFDDEA